MTEVHWCRGCGGQATGPGSCASCGGPLSLSPLAGLPESDEPEVGFELVDWSASERVDLVAWLIASRIRHRLEGDTVTVSADDEERTRMEDYQRQAAAAGVTIEEAMNIRGKGDDR